MGLVGDVKCFLQVGSESFPHACDFKNPGVLLTSESKMTQELGLVCSNEGVAPFCHSEGVELKGKVFKSMVCLCPNPQLWP